MNTRQAIRLSEPVGSSEPAGDLAVRETHRFASMSSAAVVAHRVVASVRSRAMPGHTTHNLAEMAREALGAHGVHGLNRDTGPVISISVNEELTHGVPGPRVLRSGDLVTLDTVFALNGWYADHADSWIVGGPAAPRSAPSHTGSWVDRPTLLRAAYAVCRAAVGAVRGGVAWGAIATAAEREAARWGVFLVPGFAGHGLGRASHQVPACPIPLVNPRDGDRELVPGEVITIEPIVAAMPGEAVAGPDGSAWLHRAGADGCYVERAVWVTERGEMVLSGW